MGTSSCSSPDNHFFVYHVSVREGERVRKEGATKEEKERDIKRETEIKRVRKREREK